jgi:hypothetical protein
MRHRLTARDRAQIKRELNARLQAIGEETEALRFKLQCRSPSKAAVAQYKALARLSIETREVLFAMCDAERATQHCRFKSVRRS